MANIAIRLLKEMGHIMGPMPVWLKWCKRNIAKIIFGTFIAALIAGFVAFWGTVIYVAHHFIVKYW